ncbi:putative E3 ubiquitin-protein ligase HERC4 [Smittium culicis]|uniref:Putative E3 ubiquitin-protein ligase HERC4 n=1 Tax=Smittium culicis TaxID=133412 RepID=A0A1R1XF23_9FUNG|nr:putative E3 ubiquitin-protein ligase HERC4 [Smittium culicis]
MISSKIISSSINGVRMAKHLPKNFKNGVNYFAKPINFNLGSQQSRFYASHLNTTKSIKALNIFKQSIKGKKESINRVLINFEESPHTIGKNFSCNAEKAAFKQTPHANSRVYVYSASALVAGYVAFETLKTHDTIENNDKYINGLTNITPDGQQHIDCLDPHINENVYPKKYNVPAKKINAETPMSVENQIEWAWSHPGLYVWGSNEHGTLDPERFDKKAFVHPWSVNFFSGALLKSVSFSEKHAAAIDGNGNVYQWGENVVGGRIPHKPKLTLKNMNAEKLATRVSNISAGLSHISVVTSKGRAYVAPVEVDGNKLGQIGETRTDSVEKSIEFDAWPLKQVHGIKDAIESSCGNQHTLIRTASGKVYGFGSNEFGQLALGASANVTQNTNGVNELHYIDKPTKIERENFTRTRKGKNMDIIGIASGGNTSYFVTNSWKNGSSVNSQVEVFVAGDGSNGQTGSRQFNLIQSWPTKMKEISDLVEYDESSHSQRPIGVYNISAGNNHAVVVQDNLTSFGSQGSENKDSHEPVHQHGRDVVAWGDNQFGQVLPSKKVRVPVPAHPLPLEDELNKPCIVKSDIKNKPESHSHANVNPEVNPAFMPLMPIHSRLQAAPLKTVHTFDFVKPIPDDIGGEISVIKNEVLSFLKPKKSQAEHISETKAGKKRDDDLVNVEQIFTAGHNATAAFMGIV